MARRNSGEYIDGLGVILRRTAEDGDHVTEAFVSSVVVGGPTPLPAVVPALEEWMLKDRSQMWFNVETKVTRSHGGAAGVGAELVVALLGASATISLQELWAYVKGRLGKNEIMNPSEWLREVAGDAERSVDALAYPLCRALDCRRRDVEVVTFEVEDGHAFGCFSVRGEAMYEVSAQPDGWSVRLAEKE